MNLSDGFVTYYIANIFFNIVFGYFYAYFLSSTRPAVSVIRYTLVLSFIVAPVSFLANHQIVQLAVIYAGSLLFLRMEYANSSWARIIFGFAIQVTVSAFTEFILLIGTYLMTGVLYSIEIKYALPTGAYIVEILLLLIVFTLCLRFLAKKEYEANRIFICQFLLLIMQGVSVYYLCLCFFFVEDLSDSHLVLVYMVFQSIISILLFYLLITCCQREQEKKSYILLQKEYADQLKQYMALSDSEESFQKLRHELVNYIMNHTSCGKENS